MTDKLGSGRIDLRWTGVEGEYSFGTALKLIGELTCEGFPRAVSAILFVTIRADDGLKASKSFQFGTATPIPVPLGPFPSRDDGTGRKVCVLVPVHLDVSAIEQFETARQGGDFSLRIDTVLLLLNDSSLEPRTTFNVPVYSVSYDQQILKITRDHWAQQVLQRWNRGVGIPIVISLPEVFLSEDRANIARFLKEAWQKIDGGDYQGAFMDARKSIELIRKLLNSPEQPIPDSKNDRDINQRLHAVSQALFGFASAAVHSDEAILDYLPSREDAVALVGSTAALAQAVFARLNSGGQ